MTNEQRFLIFDLDGTLSDPTVGIGRSINYALAAFDYPAVHPQTISQFIGPPLDVAFRRIAPATPDDIVLGMVAKYRERYDGSLQELRDVAPDRLLEAPDELKDLMDAI